MTHKDILYISKDIFSVNNLFHCKPENFYKNLLITKQHMRHLFKTVSMALLLLVSFATISVAENTFKNPMGIHSAYIDYSKQAKVTKNVVTDYGMMSDLAKDQSSLLQKAIDDVSAQGGGILRIPKGTYLLAGVFMKSNVHLVIDKGILLKPYWGNRDYIDMLYFFKKDSKDKNYIENCSIRGNGGRYIVDYSTIPKNQKIKVRFILVGNVKNFSIADADIKDNSSVFCAISFAPSDVKGSLDWEINRPTNGEMKNCSIFHANPGYGLCQLHGARNIYFENLYALGGVTLRLETGANTPYIGVYDIYAHDIKNENGRCAVMMGPHIAKNGTVKVDGVWTKSSSYAVKVGDGHTGGKHAAIPNVTKGYFANDSKIINIHAIYGTQAQNSTKALYSFDKSEYKFLRYDDLIPYGKWILAPSYAAVYDGTKKHYKVTFENVTTEGFPIDRKILVEKEDSPDGDETNALSMKIRDEIPHLRTWGGYTGELFTPKVPSKTIIPRSKETISLSNH